MWKIYQVVCMCRLGNNRLISLVRNEHSCVCYCLDRTHRVAALKDTFTAVSSVSLFLVSYEYLNDLKQVCAKKPALPLLATGGRI